ncbi:MAG: hypothetical protein JXA54_14200 [Candidatus Heimdallarchaeota archaeon]|nr:hypothetical protein [Candidatus Heimdallarchaeota archaeon]
MSNEMATQTEPDRTTLQTDFSSNFSKKELKNKTKEIISLLRPTIVSVLTTFIIFLIILGVSKNFLFALLGGLIIYLGFAFILQPLIKKKFGKNLTQLALKREPGKITFISSNNKSILFSLQNRRLLGISILRADWGDFYIDLEPIWDFLQEEGIHIQDCREGCYLIIRKYVDVKNTNNIQEQASKLAKEIEKTILLAKKKSEHEFNNFALFLIKDQQKILTILQLGLAPEKFSQLNELTEDDIAYIRNNSFQTELNQMEDQEQHSN